MIGVKNLRLQFGDKVVLDGVDLEVQPGEFVALIGPSGCGKSSLLRVLAGLNPAQGEVFNNQRTAFVFQEPRLFPWLPAWQNVSFGLKGSGADVQTKAQAALAEVGLSHAANLLPKELSGGMAQRVALARGLVSEPELLLLDEPFSAVDALTRLQLHEHLLGLWQAHKFAAILVTHDVDEALLLADRVVVLAGSPASIVLEKKAGPRPRSRHDLDQANLREELLAALAIGHHNAAKPQALGLSGIAV